MKAIKIILLIVVIAIALVLIIAVFVKKEYSVEREITINKPKQEIFDYIKFIKNQNNYSVWVMMDPNMKREFTGTDGTVGFISAWESKNKNVGKGEQTIKKIVEGERIESDLHFIEPFEGMANAYISTDSLRGGNQTSVRWGFHSKMKYPLNIMLLFMDVDKMIGNDLATGLLNLKTLLEKNK